jgi:hypothetical protein
VAVVVLEDEEGEGDEEDSVREVVVALLAEAALVVGISQSNTLKHG